MKVILFLLAALSSGFVRSHHLPGHVQRPVIVAALVPLNAEEEEGRTALLSEEGECNNKEYTEIDILVKENNNDPFVYTCVNKQNVTTVWSKSKVDGPAHSDGICKKGETGKVCNCVVDSVSCKRPSKWTEGAFHPDFDVEKSYKQVNQFKTLSDILGSKVLVKNYTDTTKYFFAKGHLAPNSDGAWGWEREATFHYINAVPQWQIINAGNWLRLEDATRKYAKDHRAVLDVWTGAIGVTTLKDINGTFKEIYLARDNKNHPIPFKLPAPRLMWKMIHDSESGTGIVVIMINNPYEENHLEEDRSLCPGVCERTSLVNWNRRNVTKGYTICCSVAEFKKIFQEVSAPGLDDLGDLPLLAEKEEKPLTPVKPVKPVEPENPENLDIVDSGEVDVGQVDDDDKDPEWKP